MPSRAHSVRFILWESAALLLASSALAFAEDLPEPLANVAAAVPGPPAGVPAPPSPLPGAMPLRFTPGNETPPAVRPFFGRDTLRFSSALGTEGVMARRQEGFSVRLMSRMSREAQRFRREQVSTGSGTLRGGLDEDPDTLAAARRRTEASRVVTRSIHRALNEELDRLARTSLGLGPTLSFVQSLSLRRLRADGAGRPVEAVGQREAPPSAGRPDGLRGDIGLRLDAHPALFFRARFRALQSRIDVPVRGEPFRLSLESPIGGLGRAVLSAGLPHDGQGWATLTFNITF